jgi:hypothetical protein
LSISQLKRWGEYALGDETANVLTPEETIPVFALMMDKVSGVGKWEDCKVGALTISGSSSGVLKGSVDITAKTFTGSGLTFPTEVSTGVPLVLSDDAIDTPLILADAVMTIGGTTYEFSSFELAINNSLQTIVRNSLDPQCLREGVRIVTLKANIPSTSGAWSALRDPALGGVAVVLTITSTLAAVSATIELPVCQKAASIPLVSNKTEQTFDIAFDCKTSSSEPDEITITLDTTP